MLVEAEKLDVGNLVVAAIFGTGLGLGIICGFLVQRCPKSIRLPEDVTIKQVSAGLILETLVLEVWAIAPWLTEPVKRLAIQSSRTENFPMITSQTPKPSYKRKGYL